mgnify:CR=1 FL=1
MTKKETFIAVQGLALENSFGTLKEDNGVELEVTVAINNPGYGWFEFYDVESGGDEWYAEGGIWFQGNQVTGYDGVFCLPEVVVNKLKEWGYDCSEVE